MDTNLSEVVLVKDINPDVVEFPSGFSLNSNPDGLDSNPDELVEFDDKLFFSAYDGEVGRELYVSDGTAGGTELFKDISPGANEYGTNDSSPDNFAEFNDKLYFSASNEETGRELYVTDGTAGGTELLVDLNPGNDGYGAKSSYPDNFAEFNDKLYFSASNEESGRELYVTDGTAGGTELLVDLSSGEDDYGAKSSYPDNFIEFNDKLYFTANSAESDYGLYVSDGTAGGTELLVDLNGEGTSQADNFVEFNGKLYFSANGENGNVQYVSDGTAEGTQLLVDLNPEELIYGRGSDGFYDRKLVELNDKLYFKASNGESGRELYVSDGTAEGTSLLVDIYPGEDSDYGYDGNSSSPSDLVVFNDKLYFAADDGKNGTELFVSDGTADGTKLFADIYPGLNEEGSPESSSPSSLTVVGDELFFSADNGETGAELFKLTLGSEGEEILSACSGDDLAGF
jgi:ELWxxDGT repeat protein